MEASALEQVSLGAGAAGLATALRGTVRDAVDAYQHTRVQHPVGVTSTVAAASVPMSALRPARAGALVDNASASTAAHSVNDSSSVPGHRLALARATVSSLMGRSQKGLGSGSNLRSIGESIQQSGTGTIAVPDAATAGGTAETAADGSSIGPGGGVDARNINGARLSRLLSSTGRGSRSSWEDFDTVDDTSAALNSSVHRQLG